MNAAPRRAARRRLLAAALAAAMVAGMTGCLIIPTDYHAAGSRHNVSGSLTNSLQSGVTTKDEVLLTLGEPDHASEDGQRLGYAWSKVKAILIVFSTSGGGGGEIVRSYVLELTFDPGQHLSRMRLLKGWGESVTPGRENSD